MTAPTDEELLSAHLDGDRSAFQQIVRRYHRDLYQFVYRFTSSDAIAEDVVQDTFLQLHLSGSTFDPKRRLKPWLFTIAANKARDQIRSRKRRRELPLDAKMSDNDAAQSFASILADDAALPEESLQDDERRLLVRQVVDEMPDNLTEVLVLAYFHKFPYKQIAEVLDVPLGTVKSRLHAAVQQFAVRYEATIKAREEERI